MDFSMLTNRLYRPLSHLVNTNHPELQHLTNNGANIFVSTAGCDINFGARVNLLYEMPLTLLARRFDSSLSDRTGHFNTKFKIFIHELNGCIVGPGLYQEWTNYIYAARDKLEQNLELSRSPTNNMLYYHAIKPIKMGEPLLAWYSQKVEEELCKNLLNRESLCDAPLSYKDTKCKHCSFNFEYVNILKSHLLFEFCGRSELVESHEQSQLSLHLKNLKQESSSEGIFQKSASTTPPSSLSSCSTTSSCSSTDSHKLLEIKREPKTSAFSPIFQHKSNKSRKSDLQLPSNSTVIKAASHQHRIASPSSSTSPTSTSSTCSPIQSHGTRHSHTEASTTHTQSKKPLSDNHSRVEDYLNDMHHHHHHHHHRKAKKMDQSSTQLPSALSDRDGNYPSLLSDNFAADKASAKNGIDWKITMLDGTQTVELNVSDELGKQKKTHVCLFCGKIYNRKYGLKIHLRTHTGYKPLKCKVCSRPFSDPSNLNKHVRLHSQGETPYRCPYCGKILVRKRDLDRHIMSRHSSAKNPQMSDLNSAESIEYNDDMPNTDTDEEIDMEEFDESEGKVFASNLSYYQSSGQDRSQNASPAEMSIQKIIDSS